MLASDERLAEALGAGTVEGMLQISAGVDAKHNRVTAYDAQGCPVAFATPRGRSCWQAYAAA